MNDPTGAVWAPPMPPAVPRGLCTDCGLSRTAQPGQCGAACQFIAPDYPGLETQVHGRPRDPARLDELHFGPFRRMLRASLRQPSAGAQWTGITTRIAECLLDAGAIDAVLTMAPDPADRWRPVPVLVTDAAGMAECRGMRMGYAPLLALLEPARARGYTRVAVIGIPCQVHALRAIEHTLGFDRLFVIGTPCSDNTTTERFHEFLALLAEDPATITYLEFRADYRVELRFADGRIRLIPFLQLPISKLAQDFFPLTCRTCVDYTNVLADLTVGYMGGQGEQWLIVRNERGEELLAALGDEVRVGPPGSAGRAGRGSARLHRQRGAGGGWAAAAVHAQLVAPFGWLADAPHRPARAGIRAHPRRDEGRRDRATPAPPASQAAADDGAGAHLGFAGALRPGARAGRAAARRGGGTNHADRRRRTAAATGAAPCVKTT